MYQHTHDSHPHPDLESARTPQVNSRLCYQNWQSTPLTRTPYHDDSGFACEGPHKLGEHYREAHCRYLASAIRTESR
jgi:hypothetical protein